MLPEIAEPRGIVPQLRAEYTCGVDSLRFFYCNEIPTIATDLMMLSLPVPYITRLHFPRRHLVRNGWHLHRGRS